MGSTPTDPATDPEIEPEIESETELEIESEIESETESETEPATGPGTQRPGRTIVGPTGPGTQRPGRAIVGPAGPLAWLLTRIGSGFAWIGSGIERLAEGLKLLGAACLMGMTLLTCADVVGRYMGRPIFGSVELVGFMATLAVAFALPYTHQVRGHIGVEIVIRLLPAGTRAAVEIVTNLVALALFGVVAWQMLLYGHALRMAGEVSMNLEFPEYAIIYALAFCFLVFSLMIAIDICRNLRVLKGRALKGGA